MDPIKNCVKGRNMHLLRVEQLDFILKKSLNKKEWRKMNTQDKIRSRRLYFVYMRNRAYRRKFTLGNYIRQQLKLNKTTEKPGAPIPIIEIADIEHVGAVNSIPEYQLDSQNCIYMDDEPGTSNREPTEGK
ncbi:hypothetical protein GWI33_016833 [Rhynchophorus ferrugineus]|uniref:Uncharacterized protein n=1 Tax=Rhynchophorus ferrugineus TaxID=354439 RepID=A0A834M4L4_RHYFE|nr:hypothetical protein GWI33_016833 [Rhynchophorus ferrugineus]